jgi:hypothetical protein
MRGTSTNLGTAQLSEAAPDPLENKRIFKQIARLKSQLPEYVARDVSDSRNDPRSIDGMFLLRIFTGCILPFS